MKDLKIQYATLNKETICIRPMIKEDINEVAQLYKSVAITDKNYKTKLSPKSEGSFEKNGGMFLINDKKRLEQLFYSDKELMLVAQDKENIICGFIWYSLDKENMQSLSSLKFNPNYANYNKIIKQNFKDNSLVFGKEIIVTTDKKIKQLPLLLFYCILSFLHEENFLFSTGEVYQVKGFEDEFGKHTVDMLNIRSYKTLSNSGGIHIGSIPVKNLDLQNYCVDIVSHVFIWDINKSIINMENYLNNSNIKITQSCTERKCV